MRAYKGFNPDMTCRGFRYEEGKTYETDRAELCAAGFHACEAPLEVFQYYHPSKARYHVVDLNNVSDERDGGSSQIVGKKITVSAEIGIPGLVKAHIEWTKERAQKEGAATSGDWSSAATSGNGSSAATKWDKDAKTLISARMARVDGKTIKADTWYTLRGGEFVEVPDADEN